jgi:hypothetical protein
MTCDICSVGIKLKPCAPFIVFNCSLTRKRRLLDILIKNKHMQICSNMHCYRVTFHRLAGISPSVLYRKVSSEVPCTNKDEPKQSFWHWRCPNVRMVSIRIPDSSKPQGANTLLGSFILSLSLFYFLWEHLLLDSRGSNFNPLSHRLSGRVQFPLRRHFVHPPLPLPLLSQ